jgi:hypothetical protein
MSKMQTTAPRTTTVPVTTMEEVPVLSDAEREEFMASIREAEAQLDSGDYLEFGPGELEAWLDERLAEARRKKSA